MAKYEMPDTTPVREHILEWLLNDEKVHDIITDMARRDLMARELYEVDLTSTQHQELICMGQTKFLNKILSEIISDV